MGQTIKSSLGLLAAAALLGGCGGSESTTHSSGSTAAVSSAGAATASRAAGSASVQPSSRTVTAPAGTSSTPSTTKAVRVSGMPGTTITHFGTAASANDRTAVTTLVKSYYAAIAADRGKAACALLGARIHGVIERSLGSTKLARGRGCEGTLTTVFRHSHGRPGIVEAAVTVTGVRVKGNRGYALISTKLRPHEQIRIEREHGAWKIAALIGSPLAQ